jgi:hypothetical protein
MAIKATKANIDQLTFKQFLLYKLKQNVRSYVIDSKGQFLKQKSCSGTIKAYLQLVKFMLKVR